MWSPRKLVKTVRYHGRRWQIRALAAPRSIPWLRRRLHLPANHVFDPLAEDGGADVRVIPLDPGATFERPPPVVLGGDETAAAFFLSRRRETTTASYVAEFANGVAWGHPTGGVFTADGRFAPAFTHDPCGGEFHAAWARLRLPRPVPLPGRTLYLVTPEATDNYHHWMIDLLPRLGQVQRAGFVLGEFDRIIVNFAARPYQFATLARLGIDRDKLIAATPALSIRAEQLVVPSLKGSNQTFPAADLAFLRSAFGVDADAKPQRRVFLSRADASFRRLLNEAALRPILEANGFEVVSPGALDIAAQAQLFTEAEIIAGPAGAAFASLVFASPGAHVIEMVPPQWIAAFHWMISAHLGLKHTVLLGEGPVMRGIPDAGARRLDLFVDPAKLTRVLGAFSETRLA